MNSLLGFSILFGLLAVILVLCLVAAILEAKNSKK